MELMNMSMLNRLYDPDGSNLNTMIWGQAGSGKTVLIQDRFQKSTEILIGC